ncbi:MAG: response regulator [Chloroflexi bacterium]|nr:response regulator [Chloroflexota bacterium]
MDDDRAIGLALQLALEDLGYACRVAEDGLTALRLFEEHGADVIVSDWRMPGMEGPELCQRVRALTTADHPTPYVYVILMTVLNEPRHVLAGMHSGADDFLNKPFTVDALQARMIAAERVTRLHRTLVERQAEQARLAEERRQLAEQLGRERGQLQAVIAQLPVGVLIAGAPSGEVLLVNDHVLQMWRSETADHLLHRPVTYPWRGFHADGREYRPDEWPLWRALTTGEAVPGEEIDVAWQDGTLGAVRISVAPIREDAAVLAVVCVLQDISEERRRQRGAAQTDKLRALGQMAGGVAHDLNQSLALVTGYAEMVREALQHSPRQDTVEVREMLRIITQAAYDGGETVKRLLTFSRAPVETAPEPIDLPLLLDDVAKLTAPRWRHDAQAEGRPIALHVRADPGAVIDGWSSTLREALTNLIFNAVDALPAGGEIVLEARIVGTRVRVDVRDSGIGIPPEIQERIFEPFFTTKGEQGTGLGLAMVFGIVERHRGQVTVESAPGQGATIRMEFPLRAPQAAPLPTSTASGPSGRRILLVDDHPGIRLMVSRMLSELGHQAEPVESAEAALERLAREPFDILLTDVGLGAGMNGWQLATEARARWPELAIVLATGWAAGIDAEAARAIGINEILAKPYRSADLARAVDALSGRSAPDA